MARNVGPRVTRAGGTSMTVRSATLLRAASPPFASRTFKILASGDYPSIPITAALLRHNAASGQSGVMA